MTQEELSKALEDAVNEYGYPHGFSLNDFDMDLARDTLCALVVLVARICEGEKL